MKPVNLQNLVIANKNLSSNLRDKLFNTWGVAPKPDELVSLEYMIKQLHSLDPHENLKVTRVLGGCYFGFIIPRISKELDCLWIGEKTIVNVELKSQDVGHDKIEKQLRQNSYYLRHLSKTTLLYTCDTSNGNCYSLDATRNLVSVTFQDIANAICLVHDEPLFADEIEKLFPPEKFLVSPFNSTDDFIKEHYFLTDHQNVIKDEVIKFVNDSAKGCFYAIYGGPGTGKTLLIYDIARSLTSDGKKVIIGHAGSLNGGHAILNNNGWTIHQTRDLLKLNQNTSAADLFSPDDFSLADTADVYIIDEAQRCYNLDVISHAVAKEGKKCIISLDPGQLMRDEELRYDNANKINLLVGSNFSTLSNNIRTNLYVYNFVKALFEKKKTVQSGMKDYVEVTYCQTLQEVRITQELLKSQGYEIPIFTPKSYGKEEYQDWFPPTGNSAHSVIGQEFDKVAAVISPNLHYDSNGMLISGKSYYYNEWRMLYQILSRARSSIHLIVYNNPTILERCMALMNR